jgi:DNA-binding protein H-NS
MSRDELAKLRADVDRAIALADQREMRAAREAAEAAAREHGFSLADLTSGAGASPGQGKGRKGASVASGASASEVRYRNPEDHSQTWSGRGRRPAWYNEAQAAGRSIEDLKAG